MTDAAGVEVVCPNCEHHLGVELAVQASAVTDITPAPTPDPPPPPPPPPPPKPEVLIGMNGATVTAMRAFEKTFGAMPLRSVFQQWGKLLPDQDQAHTLVVNVAMTGLWAEIAAGAHDAQIQAMAAEAKAYPGRLIVRWGGEADRRVGNASDYVAAFRRIVGIFRAAGADHVEHMWSFVEYALQTGKADAYYPGDDVVDLLGPDGYNWNGAWRSFQVIFQPAVAFAEKHGKKVLIPECACRDTEGEAARAAWLDGAAAYLEAQDVIVGFCYFNTLDPKAGVDWRLTGPQSQAAFKRLVATFAS